MFDQVGELESILNVCQYNSVTQVSTSDSPSKSAIKVLAPEFKALMTIFLSVGPVISTLYPCSVPVPANRNKKRTYRRSSSPGPGGAQFQARFSLISLVSGRKERGLPWSSSACTFSRFFNNSNLRLLNVLWSKARNSRASVERMCSPPLGMGAVR